LTVRWNEVHVAVPVGAGGLVVVGAVVVGVVVGMVVGVVGVVAVADASAVLSLDPRVRKKVAAAIATTSTAIPDHHWRGVMSSG